MQDILFLVQHIYVIYFCHDTFLRFVEFGFMVLQNKCLLDFLSTQSNDTVCFLPNAVIHVKINYLRSDEKHKFFLSAFNGMILDIYIYQIGK